MHRARAPFFVLSLLIAGVTTAAADSMMIKNGCSVPVTVVGYVTHCEVSHPGGRCSSPKPECGNFNPLAPDEPTYNPSWRCSSPVPECRGTVEAGSEAVAGGCSDCITRVELSYRKADGTEERTEKEISNLRACWFTGKYAVRIVQVDPKGPSCDIE